MRRSSTATELATGVERAVDRVPAAVASAWDDLALRRVGEVAEVAALIERLRRMDGGKYLRPRLAATAYLGCGGRDEALLDALGTALQLLHLGLCVHDDLIDGDEVRHGRPNIAGSVRRATADANLSDAAAARQGDAAALLAGDLALSLSQSTLLHAPAPADVRIALLDELAGAVEETIGGELLDVRSEVAAPADADAITVAELKTARYSVILPLRLGAIAAGESDPTTLAALHEVGRHLGVVYQLVDDELGVFGDPEVTGKSALSDLRDGKRTELVRLACAGASSRDRATLERHLGREDLTETEAAMLRRLIEGTGAREQLRSLIDARLALALLAADRLPSDLGATLADIARASARRTR